MNIKFRLAHSFLVFCVFFLFGCKEEKPSPDQLKFEKFYGFSTTQENVSMYQHEGEFLVLNNTMASVPGEEFLKKRVYFFKVDEAANKLGREIVFPSTEDVSEENDSLLSFDYESTDLKILENGDVIIVGTATREINDRDEQSLFWLKISNVDGDQKKVFKVFENKLLTKELAGSLANIERSAGDVVFTDENGGAEEIFIATDYQDKNNTNADKASIVITNYDGELIKGDYEPIYGIESENEEFKGVPVSMFIDALIPSKLNILFLETVGLVSSKIVFGKFPIASNLRNTSTYQEFQEPGKVQINEVKRINGYYWLLGKIETSTSTKALIYKLDVTFLEKNSINLGNVSLDNCEFQSIASLGDQIVILGNETFENGSIIPFTIVLEDGNVVGGTKNSYSKENSEDLQIQFNKIIELPSKEGYLLSGTSKYSNKMISIIKIGNDGKF